MVSKVFLLWAVFLIGGWCWCPGDACWDIEKTALLRLKPFFDSYIDGFDNWLEGSDCCEWGRIECDKSTKRVIQISLNNTITDIAEIRFMDTYNLRPSGEWFLNISLFLPFEELQSLYLPYNSIAGFLDHQGIEKLSRKLKKLKNLDLRGNSFNDSILASLSQLSSLEFLDLADNRFTGSNPIDGIKSLSKLKNLKTLDLYGNIFGNSIISNLANFTSLGSLSLQNCGLKGTVQIQELNNLVNLKDLYLNNNGIEAYPKKNGIESLETPVQGELKLKKLEVLGLSGNLFNDSIFSSLTSLSNLKSLDINWNKLEGPIHIKDINALRRLEELDMLDNQVNDFVPSQGNERFMNLKALHLGRNLFNNSIMTSLGRLSNLKSLSFGGGPKFQGLIDLTELNALTHLEYLMLYCDHAYPLPKDNNCSLPLQSLGLFPSLKALYLDGFSFQGTIMISQNQRHNLSNLEELFPEGSLLQDNFLGSIGQFTSLTFLILSNCEINGTLTLHDERHQFTSLEELILENSFLPTDFLGSIGQFTSLKRLEFSHCEINGSITLQGFCELQNLQDLYFNNNNLKGSLPECFSNLTSLERLDLSFNQFSGNISAIQTLSSLKTLKLCSNQFSGNISVFHNLTSLLMLDLSSNQFSGNIYALKSLVSLRVLILSNNHFRIPISFEPLFNLSKLKLVYVDNNTVHSETQMHSLAPMFQLEELGLSCCGDVGSFPEFLYHQHQLEYLHLSDIHFKGDQFPDWLLENNTKLGSLILANSSLSGQLRLPLASRMHLYYFDVSNNFFTGSIPVEIGEQLPELRFLNMSNNDFIGSIPSSFGDMSSLGTLDLSNNQLSGTIPEHLTVSNLSLLALSNNKLKGEILSENSYLPQLYELKLDGNKFYGRIPNVLSNSHFLSILDLSNNQLSGRIPRWMGNMSYLEKLIISNNYLQGTIPVEFCRLDLLLIDLSVNNISGTLPSCFSPLRIRQVHLSKNRLRGTLPKALRDSSTLVTLDISDNFLSGSIPSWIGGLSNLSYLLLSNNNFQGRIPMELCHLNHLSLINLSQNKLSGRIPPCLKVTTLQDLSEDYVDGLIAPGPSIFSLNEPIDFPIKNVSNSYKGRIISYISGIDLSSNDLVGEIPYEFGNLYKILVLNLSHNSLTGTIPPTFANLKQIESLDLSYNKLSGSIPPQLVGLNFLAYFVVSFNNLSGKTPPRTAQFGTFDESSYRGNPFLCGEPLPKCGDIEPTNSSTDGDEEDGLIDMGVFRVSFVVSYVVLLLTVAVVLFINPHWRRAWFYHAETTVTSCYYFVLDNILPRRFHC